MIADRRRSEGCPLGSRNVRANLTGDAPRGPPPAAARGQSRFRQSACPASPIRNYRSTPLYPMPAPDPRSAIEISRQTKLLPIEAVAAKLGIGPDDIEFYGRTRAKISLDLYRRLETAPQGKLILVTAINPNSRR